MGVLIPSAFANQLKVSPGDQMRIVLNGQNLLITPVKKKEITGRKVCRVRRTAPADRGMGFRTRRE